MIMQIVPEMNQGGVERGTVEIAAALQKAGIKNCVVSAGGRLVAELERLGVEHITLPVASKNPAVILANARRLAAIASSKGVRVMHVRSRAPAWSVLLASRRSGIPFISTYHGVYGTKPSWLKIPYNRVMLLGSKVIAPSRFVRDHILRTYKTDPEKIKVIPRGADTEIFSPAAVTDERLEQLREKYGIGKDCRIISMVGRLTRIKGHQLLLDALRAIEAHRIFVLFIGSDQGRADYTRQLEEQIAALPSNITVKIDQSSPNMPEIYALSEFVVSASTVPEAFGRTIPEAQAMERIVLAAAHGGACETIEDGVSGFLFEPGSRQSLQAQLEELLIKPEAELTKIRRLAGARTRENFSVAKMCDSTIGLYRSLL